MASRSSYRRDKAADLMEPAAPAAASRRRSHSVSAIQRRTTPMHDDPSISGEFSNRRDNPLFWARLSPPPREGGLGKVDPSVAQKSFSSNSREANKRVNGGRGFGGEPRGRSVKRTYHEKKGIGRSLSRAREEPSSGIPCGGNHGITKGKRTEEAISARGGGRSESVSKHTYRTKLDKSGLVQNLDNAVRERIQDPAADWGDDFCCDWRALNLDDALSVSSFSETEKKSVKGVQRMRDKLAREISSSSGVHETLVSEVAQAVSDIDLHSPPRRKDAKLGFPNYELVGDCRRDYTIELKESEVRAEKLRAELAVEEYRQQELDRILGDMLTYSRSSTCHKSLQKRVRNERKAVSKQLTEDAFAYFDECVSLSTFDSSSEFSATEDPVLALSGAYGVLDFAYPPNRISDALSPYKEGFGVELKQIELGSSYAEFSSPSVTSRMNEVRSSQHTEVSCSDDKKLEATGPKGEEVGKSYMRFFGTALNPAAAAFDAGEYKGLSEDILADRVLFNNRIVSGGLVLCHCSTPSFQPFCG